MAFTTACPSLSRRPATTTFAPVLANCRAAASPMPEVPPVTNATLFFSEVFMFVPFLFSLFFHSRFRLYAADISCIARFSKS